MKDLEAQNERKNPRGDGKRTWIDDVTISAGLEWYFSLISFSLMLPHLACVGELVKLISN